MRKVLWQKGEKNGKKSYQAVQDGKVLFNFGDFFASSHYSLFYVYMVGI